MGLFPFINAINSGVAVQAGVWLHAALLKIALYVTAKGVGQPWSAEENSVIPPTITYQCHSICRGGYM